MKSFRHAQPVIWPVAAWFAVGLAGAAAPALAMLALADAAAPATLLRVGGAILAVGLMGAGMIGAAVTRNLRGGVVLAVLSGTGLVLLAHMLGMPVFAQAPWIGFAAIIASISFAARGALFARSAGDKGWWIAVFVVCGEVAILATALALPDRLPAWLLALLPAQWASSAIETALGSGGTLPASAPLIALAGTAAATLLVAQLLPRRWPYLIMFTAWLACSALVWHRPAPPPVQAAATASPIIQAEP
ncbi:MAG: hypothetical protein ACJLS3_11360 [Erythrobacter sp.]